MRLLTPGRFALCALAVYLLWLIAPGVVAGRWRSPPLRIWNEQSDGATWVRNRDEGWVYALTEAFDAAASPGLALRIEPTHGGQAVLEVQWRAFGEEAWHSHRFVCELGRTYGFYRLDADPGWVGEVSELAVRILERPAPEILALAVESRGVEASLRRAWDGFRTVEIFGDTAINTLSGTRVAGLGLSAVLSLALLAYLVPTLAAARRDSARAWRAFFTVALGAWCVLDLRFSADLVANARVDWARFPLLADADALVRGGPPEYTALVDAVREHVPESARTVFLTDDPGFLIRAKYVFYPRPAGQTGKRARITDNDYFVLFRDSGSRFDAATRTLRLRDGRDVPVRLIATTDGGAIYAARKADAPTAVPIAAPRRSDRGAGAAIVVALASGIATWLLGLGAVVVLDRGRRLGAWCVAGAAYPCGAALVTAILVVLGLARIPMNLISAGSAAALAGAGFLVASRRHGVTRQRLAPVAAPQRQWTPLEGILVALILTKLAFVVFELLRRPPGAWDTFAIWGMRAKVWAARGALVLERGDPFFLGGGARYDYPPHVSLLQTWTAYWLGAWNDVLVHLPWGLYYASALLFVFGALYRRRSRLVALLITAALAGLPLFVVHAALAGYADLVLAVHFLVAVTAIYLWAEEDGERGWLNLALFFIATLPWVKLEGIPLAVACALALAAQSRRFRAGAARWVLAASAVLVALAAALIDPTLRAYLASSTLETRALRPLFYGLFGAGNWQLLWIVMLLAALAAARRWWATPTGWLLFAIAAPAALLVYVLVATSAARFAIQSTADSRLFLALAPAALVFAFEAAAALVAPARAPVARVCTVGVEPGKIGISATEGVR